MTEKRFRYYEEENGEFPFPYIKDSDGKDIISLYQCYECMNALHEENEQLKEALKNSYMNEICENCKYGNYFLSDNYYGGFEGDFECLKKHFGNDHWECDGLTECDEFELEIKGDVE